MGSYWVTIRGVAEQEVRVEADSKSEAREKAARGDFVDQSDYPDFVRWPDGRWRTWPAPDIKAEEDEPVASL